MLKEEITELIEENNFIKCTKKIKPKDILYDGSDDIIFIGKEFQPKYRYYNHEDSLIIEIELCSDYEDLKVTQQYDKISKETLFTITGERIIEDEGEKNGELIFDFGNKRENYKRFNLQLKIKLKDIGIKHLEKKYEEEMQYGILFLRFKALK